MLKKTIAFVWWWSGGHIQPIASLLDYAKQYTNISKQSKRYRFGQEWWLEQDYAHRYEEVTFVAVSTWKLRRYLTLNSLLQNIGDVFLIGYGFFESLWYLKKYSIDIVFCKGWFVCPQVAYAWRLLRIPVLVHESDTHLWLANRLILPIASTVFTWFWWVTKNDVVVWQILSPCLLQKEAVLLNWINNNKTTILVMWWSQWARILFDIIYQLVSIGEYWDTQFIFLLWTKSAWVKEKYEGIWQIWTQWFVSQWQIASLYEISDIAVTRGSASALQEQQLFGLKKAIVPLPYTWWDHQTVNAKWYEKNHNDTRIPQDERLKEQLHEYILECLWYKKTHMVPTVDQLCSASEVLRKKILE